MNVTPKQRDALKSSTARINLYTGAIRTGKTTGVQIPLALHQMVNAPPGAIGLCGRTERTLERNVLQPIRETIGTGNVKTNFAKGEARILGRLCYLFGASNLQAYQKLMGATLAGLVGDEVVLWPENFTKAALGRMSVPGARAFFTANPGPPSHFIKTGWIDTPNGLDINHEHFTLEDAPFLDPKYVANLKAEYGPPSSMFYRRYILGLWVAAEGAIWNVDRDLHINATWRADPIEQTWIAIDYGTTHPFVALALHFQPEQQRIVVAGEWRWDAKTEGKQLSDPQYITALERWIDKRGFEPAGWIVDPSAASFRTLARQHGHRVRKANNAVHDGLRYVGTLLAATPQPRLVFDPVMRESVTLREMDGYVWQDGTTEAPVKADDDGPDALRYGIATTRRVWRDWMTTDAA